MAKRPKINAAAETERQERFKRLAIISLFSDDDLMELFALKGGNAIDLIYGAGTRASIDVDVSMESDFKSDELEEVRKKLQTSFENTFRPEGYEPFDVTLTPKPDRIPPGLTGFWGGYSLEFKIIELSRFNELKSRSGAASRESIMIGGKGKFQIDISKYEYTATKERYRLDGYSIYVYTPQMIVAEKLRAVCQQMPKYTAIVHKNATPRSRDFLDIYALVDHFQLDMAASDNCAIIRNVFAAKQVPLLLASEIHFFRDFHKTDFISVQATVKPGTRLQSFDFYFDFVLSICDRLKSLWYE